MAEWDHPVVQFPNTKRPTSELADHKNNLPPKILSGFLYKAIIFAVFIALLPLFPSQYSEPTNHPILSRTCELLHLLLVGIAVSYGLFSRRNADVDLEKDKDPTFKADTPQSYVSRILQVSPVFDDYAEVGAVSADESKIETWNSQYQSADPVVVVAKGGSSGGKPLLLPVRSLKNSRVQNSDGLTECSVLPSPIPWRSRSGRFEAAEEGSAINASSRTTSFHSPPVASISEMAANTSEISFMEKLNRSDRAPPPPVPPPPPPPPSTHGSIFVEKREVKKSFKDELNDLSRKGREGFLKSSYLVAEQMTSEMPSSPRSVRTMRSKEVQKKHQVDNEEKRKKKENTRFMEKMILVSDDSNSEIGSDSSDDSEPEPEPAKSITEVGTALQENEVDKKADEFIAKFREQIRLQRIESIKKSSGHKSVKKTDK